ncbi:hypothetical protein RJT34_00466 [Clitoria ternatea]|uniref:Uncharacterized protein n=1 Tax=Clitoria ternatea TaxID=43366 RepID=A0AAN9PZA5_CLITE
MVNILASHIVVPNEATPECHLWLSNNDHVAYLDYVSTIYAYKARHSNDVFERMKNSLGEILVHYYPVAGRLRLKENGRMELECNAQGVLLLEAESSKTLDDYGDFLPSDECVKELVPTRDPTQPVDQLPLLMVQLTRFNRDEGFIIGVACSHVLCDGLAATRFINAWAKITRGDTLDPNEMPFLDRTILNEFPPLPSAPCFDHPELKPPPLILGRSDSIEEQKKKTSVALLKLTAEQVSKLKKKANYNGGCGSTRSPYSRFEAIVAHIWRCASKARELDDNQPTQVILTISLPSSSSSTITHNAKSCFLSLTDATSAAANFQFQAKQKNY